MRTSHRVGIVALAAMGLLACRRTGGASLDAGASGFLPTTESEPGAPDVELRTRCRWLDSPKEVPGRTFVPGNAVAYQGGIAISQTTLGTGTAVGSVQVFDDKGQPAKQIDLGAQHPDAPPPRLVATDKGDLVAGYVVAGSDRLGTRTFVVREVFGKRQASMTQQADDSFASDIAVHGGDTYLVWDEEVKGRGVVRLAILRATGDAWGPAEDLSGEDTDADSPRAFALEDAVVVVWKARQPDSGAAPTQPRLGRPLASASRERFGKEGPGQRRVPEWLMAQRFSGPGKGASATPVSSRKGFLSYFDAAPRRDERTLRLLVRDEEGTDGAGARVVSLLLSPDRAGAPEPVPLEALGPGGIEVVGPRLGAVFADSMGRARWVALSEGGLPLGTSSVEPVLTAGRLLWMGRDGLGVVGTTDLGLRSVTCSLQ